MTNTKEKPVDSGSKLQLKDTFFKLYNLAMFVGPAISAYVLWFNGNTMTLQGLAAVLAIDAAAHAYKLIAVVK